MMEDMRRGIEREREERGDKESDKQNVRLV
jgi:hypothetical protein